MSVLDRVFDRDPALAKAIAEKHQISPDLRRAPVQPVLVEANQVPVRILRSERGEAADVQLDSMQQLTDKLASRRRIPIPVIWDQMNFELVSPVPIEMLRFYDIQCHDSSVGCRDFTLVEIP